jgi:hypothetical protein
MDLAEFVLEALHQLRTVAQEFRSHPQLGRALPVGEPPGGEGDHDRKGLDAGLGERVGRPLAPAHVLLREEPSGDELLETAAQDVGRDSLDRAGPTANYRASRAALENRL